MGISRPFPPPRFTLFPTTSTLIDVLESFKNIAKKIETFNGTCPTITFTPNESVFFKATAFLPSFYSRITCCKIQIPKTCGKVFVNFQYIVAAKCSKLKTISDIIFSNEKIYFFEIISI